MNRCPPISHTSLLLCLLSAGIVSFGATAAANAAGKPEPTFLESSANDLIRFQKGDVPPISDALVPLQESRIRVQDTREEAMPETTGLFAMPEPAAEAEIVADAPAPMEKPAERQDRESDDLRAAPASSGFTSLFSPDIAPAAVPKRAQRLSSKAVSPATAPAPAPEPDPIDEEINARLVTVCLNNPGDASGAKAFDIRRDGPPRYLAEVGATACARFEPTRHTVYFWKSNDLGALSLVLSSRLDLNDSDGTQVTMDWLRD